MTFILALDSPKSCWMVADRRLSIDGVPKKEDARKLILLDTTDGFGIVGYAGLGRTEGGTEPSDWMSSVLLGRALPLETSLSVLADAMKRELEPHLPTLSGPGPYRHVALATGIVGGERRMLTINILVDSDGKELRFECHRHDTDLVACGTGRKYLEQDLSKYNELGRLVNLVDAGTVPPERVADYLAALNLRIHRWHPSVGPNCIVAWRRSDDASGSFGLRFYSGTDIQPREFSVPHLSRGTPINRILGIISRVKSPSGGFGYTRADGVVIPPPDYSPLAELATLPTKPDETLY